MTAFKLLPRSYDILSSPLKSEEGVANLYDEVEEVNSTKLAHRGSAGKSFAGAIKEQLFKLRRNIDYRNSFLPIIQGQVVDADNGCNVHLKMRMHPLVRAILAIWIVGLAWGMPGIPSPIEAIPHWIFPLVMIIAGYLWALYMFNIERSRALQKLKEVFQVRGDS